MIEQNNTIQSWNQTTAQNATPSQAVYTIQNVTKDITEYAMQIRKTVKTLREAGVISEIALAIREGSFALRDTVQDIHDTTVELKRKGIITDTANAVEDTMKTVEESITAVREISEDAKHAIPNTTNILKESLEGIALRTNKITELIVHQKKVEEE